MQFCEDMKYIMMVFFLFRKSLAEHQAMASEMDKEKREMEMAIARSVVDHQRLEIEKKSQEDLMEQQMKKLSLTTPTPGTGNKV